MSKKTGTVTMSLEEYNELILELARYREGITVFMSTWNQEKVEVVFNTNVFKPIIEEKMKDFPDYQMFNYFGNCSNTVGELIKDKETQED